MSSNSKARLQKIEQTLSASVDAMIPKRWIVGRAIVDPAAGDVAEDLIAAELNRLVAQGLIADPRLDLLDGFIVRTIIEAPEYPPYPPVIEILPPEHARRLAPPRHNLFGFGDAPDRDPKGFEKGYFPPAPIISIK
jgi:hypothetical protein